MTWSNLSNQYYSIVSLQPQVAVYYESLSSATDRRPAGRTRDAPGNAIRIASVHSELDTETRGIDVTRQAESIGEGIRV